MAEHTFAELHNPNNTLPAFANTRKQRSVQATLQGVSYRPVRLVKAVLVEQTEYSTVKPQSRDCSSNCPRKAKFSVPWGLTSGRSPGFLETNRLVIEGKRPSSSSSSHTLLRSVVFVRPQPRKGSVCSATHESVTKPRGSSRDRFLRSATLRCCGNYGCPLWRGFTAVHDGSRPAATGRSIPKARIGLQFDELI